MFLEDNLLLSVNFLLYPTKYELHFVYAQIINIVTNKETVYFGSYKVLWRHTNSLKKQHK